MVHAAGTQDDVFIFLAQPSRHGAPTQRIDTHISVVFLAGECAYKIKRAVRLPFLDFSTLTKRKAACDSELEANQPFAPDARGRGYGTFGAVQRLPTERPMSRLFEASKSLTAIEQDSAIIAVIEIRRGGFCSSFVPGVERACSAPMASSVSTTSTSPHDLVRNCNEAIRSRFSNPVAYHHRASSDG